MIGTMYAYAKYRKALGLPGCSKQAVHRAVESGRISLVNGKVDFEAADAAWLRNTSVEQQARSKRDSVQSSGAFTKHEQSEGPEDYLAARSRKEAALADLAEMEAAELRGETSRNEEVSKCWGEMLASLRARLLVLPSMAAPLIAAPGKAAEVQAIIRKLVNEALQELSGDGIPEAAKGRARRRAADTETAA